MQYKGIAVLTGLFFYILFCCFEHYPGQEPFQEKTSSHSTPRCTQMTFGPYLSHLLQRRWERIFRLWKISAMDMVRKAMVMPSALSVIAQTPLSIKWPIK